MNQAPVFVAIFGTAIALVLAGCSGDGDPDDDGMASAGAGQGGGAGDEVGGASTNEAGSASVNECPVDFAAADGKDCTAYGEGAVCISGNKCGGGEQIVCVEGVWQRRQGLVIPC